MHVLIHSRTSLCLLRLQLDACCLHCCTAAAAICVVVPAHFNARATKAGAHLLGPRPCCIMSRDNSEPQDLKKKRTVKPHRQYHLQHNWHVQACPPAQHDRPGAFCARQVCDGGQAARVRVVCHVRQAWALETRHRRLCWTAAQWRLF